MPLNKGRTGQSRKILSFYRVNFDYAPPYRVLCDGDMIYQSLRNDLYLKQSLPTILSAPALPVITNCVLEDLRSRGAEYSNATLFAKRATRLPCAHKEKVNATECLLQKLRNNSEAKLMASAANIEVLKQLTRIPGIPLITIFNKTKLVLKPPSKATLEFVRKNERAKVQIVGETDKILLERIKAEARANRPVRKVIVKKRKAKGPNPLSIKKPKNESQKHADVLEIEKDKEHDGEQRNLNTSPPSVVSGISIAADDALNGIETKLLPASGKRKRGRRRAAKPGNGPKVDDNASPIGEKSREQIPSSTLNEGTANKMVGSNHLQLQCTLETTTNPSGCEMNANKLAKRGSRREDNVDELVANDGHAFIKSVKQDELIKGNEKDDNGGQTETDIPTEQVNVAGEVQARKRKKQRKNRRRRSSKNQ